MRSIDAERANCAVRSAPARICHRRCKTAPSPWDGVTLKSALTRIGQKRNFTAQSQIQIADIFGLGIVGAKQRAIVSRWPAFTRALTGERSRDNPRPARWTPSHQPKRTPVKIKNGGVKRPIDE